MASAPLRRSRAASAASTTAARSATDATPPVTTPARSARRARPSSVPVPVPAPVIRPTARAAAALPDGARQDETTGGFVHDAATLSDKALAIRVAKNDVRAWNDLYKKWQQELTRYGLAQGWDRELVDDLVQDTLVRAWQKRTSYNSQYPYRVWILTIFRRLAMTHYRRVKTHDKTVETQPVAPIETPWWQEGHTTMGREIGSQDLKRLLEPILEEMRPEDRRLLEAWSHDESQAELARDLGINPVTLRTQILRAKQRMSKAFAKRYPHLVSAGWGDTGGSIDE